MIQAGRGSLAHQEKKIYKKLLFFFFFLTFFLLWVKKSERLPGEEREQEERGIRELLQPPSVLQGKMDSDSGEQSDGELSPGKPQDHY